MEFYIATCRRVKLHINALCSEAMRKPRSDYPSEQADKFLVRLPDGMRDRIARAAEANGRSMNAEIVQTLADRYPEENPVSERLRELLTMADRLRTDDTPAIAEFRKAAEEVFEMIRAKEKALDASKARREAPEGAN